MKAIHSKLLSCFLFSVTQAFASAQTTTIDFEGLPSMTPVPATLVPASARLSDQLLNTYGVRFTSSSASSFVAVAELGVGIAPSGVNGIVGVDSKQFLSYYAPVRVEFFLPGDPSTPAVTDFVSIRGDLDATSGQLLLLDAYDVNGTLLETDFTFDQGIITMTIARPDIHFIEVTDVYAVGVAWDDLTFGTLVGIPEPSTISVAGMTCVVLLLLRRRRLSPRNA